MILNERESQILIYTIEIFIDTAIPVSSSQLMIEKKLSFSSATIRSIMANLEKLSYLKKAHNQSGRIPTTEGYKYYTEKIESSDEIDNEELITKLDQIFKERVLGVNNVIEESVKIISEITDLVTIAKSSKSNYVLEAINLFVIDEEKSAITVVTSDNSPMSELVKNPKGISSEDLSIAIRVFNDRLKGSDLRDIKNNLILMKPLVSKKVKNADKVFELISSMILNGLDKEEQYKYGTSNIVNYKDVYDGLDREELLSIIEDNSIWKILEELGHSGDDHSNLIFTNKENSKLDNVVIINREIEVKGVKTSFALAAPKRVRYKEINTIFNWLESKLEMVNGDNNE